MGLLGVRETRNSNISIFAKILVSTWWNWSNCARVLHHKLNTTWGLLPVSIELMGSYPYQGGWLYDFACAHGLADQNFLNTRGRYLRKIASSYKSYQ